MTKTQIKAVFEAASVLQNKDDGLRVERASLRLAKYFSAGAAERIAKYILAEIEPKPEVEPVKQ